MNAKFPWITGSFKVRSPWTAVIFPFLIFLLVEDHLFTGDSYIPGVKVVTNLPGGDRRTAAESVSKILELGKGKKICAGHRVELV